MVVKTVPGTVARIQSAASYAAVLRCAPSDWTLGASRSVQPSESVHSPGAVCVSDGPRCGRLIAIGLEKVARECGMVAGAWGARDPAWPRVGNGHGFEPSSNWIREKSGLAK